MQHTSTTDERWMHRALVVAAQGPEADANLAYKYLGLAHLDDGATAQVALDRLIEEDDGREHRQAGVVDSDGNAATYTGTECFAWAGGVTGRSGERGGYAIQGIAGAFVVKLSGSYSGVVGLPLMETASLLAGEGYPVHFNWLNQSSLSGV